MRKEEQTTQVIQELCNLTKKFTRAYQPKYYYQFHGDLYDLAMEFFCDFLTPKGRKRKETLLDKFDSKVTSLPYLVKVSVIRKLIDRSRANPATVVSIDAMLEEHGDMIARVFNLFEETPDEVEIPEKSYKKIYEEYQRLDDFTKNSLYAKLYDISSPLCNLISPSLYFINGCPVQQITDKTVVLYHPMVKSCINFSVEDGHPKGSFKPFHIDVSNLKSYHSGFDRELFTDYCTDRLHFDFV